MGSESESYEREMERIHIRESHASRVSPPVPGTKRKADSSDFAALGGQFSQGSNPYPSNIDLTEEEQVPRSSHLQSPRATSFPPSLPGIYHPPTDDPSSARSRSSPILQFRGPYIQPSDLARLPGRKYPKRNHTNATRSSEKSFDHTSDGDHPSTTVHDEDEDEGGHDRSITPTPRAPPTPSRHSLDSTDEDGTRTECGPSSPNPYSSWYPYNPLHGRVAISSIEASGSVEQQPSPQQGGVAVSSIEATAGVEQRRPRARRPSWGVHDPEDSKQKH